MGFFWIDGADASQARKQFAKTFAFFLTNYVEKHYYRLDIGGLAEDGQRRLVDCFKDEQVFLPKNAAELWKNAHVESVAMDMIHRLVPFRDYQHNAYDYVFYDSMPEKHAGDILNSRLDAYVADPKTRPVWIKNQRQVSFGYGTRRYFPDFIVCNGERMYILETKGDAWSDQRKNQLLAAVERVTEGRVKGVLAFSDWIDRFGIDAENLDDFFLAAEIDATRRLQLLEPEFTPPENEKYKAYLPIFTPEKAHKKWNRGREGVRNDGWAKVQALSRGSYPTSCFAIPNKSRHLAHLGSWLVLDSSPQVPEPGQSALLHYAEFDDEYKRGFSVRQITIKAEKTGGLIDQEVWELSQMPGEHLMRLRPGKQRFDVVGIVIEHIAQHR
jgi:type III restriction enzyme